MKIFRKWLNVPNFTYDLDLFSKIFLQFENLVPGAHDNTHVHLLSIE